MNISRPRMKQVSELTLADFVQHPIWIGVHHYDIDEPWYEEADEQTVRPWTGKMPFGEIRGRVVVATDFVLADGSVYPGYCYAVPEDWDKPLILGKTIGGAVHEKSWSEMHGGIVLSILLLQSPTIFVNGRSFDFQLRIPELRREYIQNFYTALGKAVEGVFPIQFTAEKELALGIVSGTIDGFFRFPLWRDDFEIDRGESFLAEATHPNPPANEKSCTNAEGPEEKRKKVMPDGVPKDRSNERVDLTLEDFAQHPAWVRVPLLDKSKPFPPQYRFVPWTGPFPIDSRVENVRVPASFSLLDGSEYQGYVRAVPEDWADIVPPPTPIGGGSVIQVGSPRERFGGSPLAIAGEHQPCLFIGNQKFYFWCGPKCDLDELRDSFYRVVGKRPDEIFPITFSGAEGYATGIVSGSIEGFYEIRWGTGKSPKIVR